MAQPLGAAFHTSNGVTYLTFPLLDSIGVVNAFSTRIGGVSQGHLAGMNFSFSRGEDACNVRENYRRMGAVLGFSRQEMVASRQTHEDRVLPVDMGDAGDGVLGNPTLCADALMTQQAGLLLVKHFADCTPIYLADPVDRRLVLIHAGWRGTVMNLCGKAVARMLAAGSRASNLYAAIGPAISPEHFEVDEPVAKPFRNMSDGMGVVIDRPGQKPHVDLWQTNRNQLLAAGVPRGQLAMAGLCTYADEKHFYSHRRDRGHTGTLASFMGFARGSFPLT